MGHYRSKSCTNLVVSRAHNNGRFSRLIKFTSGLVQGGELVTARATAMTQGAF